MPRGGARSGAGRKPGSRTVKTSRVAKRLTAEAKLTPLAVLLFVMEWHLKARRYQEAASAARDAAPYMHSKFATHDHTFHFDDAAADAALAAEMERYAVPGAAAGVDALETPP